MRRPSADVLVVLTEWNEFRGLDPRRLKQAMRGRASSTCATSSIPRRCAAGLRLRGVGRPKPRT